MSSASAELRLPDFIGVGPARTGTTWLNAALGEVAGLPRVKETRFFSQRYHKGIEWYAAHFRHCDASAPVGEICPYFSAGAAVDRIYGHIPGCKIISTFRDPVDRAYSYYQSMRKFGRAGADFEQTLARRREPAEGNRYAFYLSQWQERFGASRVLIMLYDDLVTDPQAYLDRICAFIGAKRVDLKTQAVPPWTRNRVERDPQNQPLAFFASYFRAKLSEYRCHRAIRLLGRTGLWAYCFERGTPFPPLSPDVDARVRERFRPEVEALEHVIGRDLSAWKAPGGGKGPTSRIAADTRLPACPQGASLW